MIPNLLKQFTPDEKEKLFIPTFGDDIPIRWSSLLATALRESPQARILQKSARVH